MWRALFFLGGLFLLTQGGITLAIDTLTLHDWAVSRLGRAGVKTASTVRLPIWLAPTLVSTGTVTLVYAIALPSKDKDEK